jgi:cytochrome c2
VSGGVCGRHCRRVAGQSVMLMTLLMHNFWAQEEIQINFKKPQHIVSLCRMQSEGISEKTIRKGYVIKSQ